jgi:hypothetical protein
VQASSSLSSSSLSKSSLLVSFGLAEKSIFTNTLLVNLAELCNSTSSTNFNHVEQHPFSCLEQLDSIYFDRLRHA